MDQTTLEITAQHVNSDGTTTNPVYTIYDPLTQVITLTADSGVYASLLVVSNLLHTVRIRTDRQFCRLSFWYLKSVRLMGRREVL